MSSDIEEIKQAVREAMSEILAELRPMPSPVPPPLGGEQVTEIIIRVGPAGALQIAPSFGPTPQRPDPCCDTEAIEPDLPADVDARLQELAERTGLSRSALLRKLQNQGLSELLKREIERMERSVE